MDASYDPPAQFRTAADQLHDIVAKELGTTDFGPDDYLPGLTVLLQSMDHDPHFHEQGKRLAWGQVIGVLRSRASAIAAMQANPGFDENPILAPVVIVGVPRTGTTALHRLMAVDPRFQGLQTWLIDNPMPRPPIERWGDYPQFRKTVAGLDAHYAATPEARAAHHRAAEEVHECCMILWHSFNSNIWACGNWSSPTYDAWRQCQEEDAAYDYYTRCVQLIGSNEPEKRWLLKNPGHIEQLDLLFACYPDARVIQTHRDPAKAIPSLCALLMHAYPVYEQGRAGAARAQYAGARGGEMGAGSAPGRAGAAKTCRPDSRCRPRRFSPQPDGRTGTHLQLHRHGYRRRSARCLCPAHRRQAGTATRRPSL